MEIAAADTSFPLLARACDFSFDITAEALPPFDGPTIGAVRPVPPRRKSYPVDFDRHAGRDQGNPVLVATEGEKLLGYAALSHHWNGLAALDDIAVDRPARSRGVGGQLIRAAADWARANALAGLFAETQSNNVAACRFYENNGFVLGGHDRLLYVAFAPHRQEIALFWYLLL